MDPVWLFLLHVSAYLSLGLWVGSLVVKHHYLPRQFTVMAAFGCIAVLYYVVFFLSLASPTVGQWVDYSIHAAGWCVALYGLYKIKSWINNKTVLVLIVLPVSLIVMLTGYYSIVLNSCMLVIPMAQKYDNSTFCHIHALPGDNALPFMYAKNVAHNQADVLISDWKLADRPPVQIGAGLTMIHLSTDEKASPAGYQLVATFLQLSWVAAIFGALITFGLKLRNILLAVGMMSLCGFIYLNSIFVWPKFFAASLVLMGCVLVLKTASEHYRRTIISALVAMGLGLLIHDGVTFTILSTAAVLGFIFIKNKGKKPLGYSGAFPLRALIIGGVLAALLVGPWLVYKSGHTTSDHLIKWHFAGVVQTDSRSTITTIVDSYKQISLHDWYHGRVANLQMLAGPLEKTALPDAAHTFGFSKAAIKKSLSFASIWYQQNDFYIILFALGGFNIGWLAVLFKVNRRSISVLEKRLLAMTFLSISVWVLVMFLPYSTVLHQGSYATPLILYGLLAVWIARINFLLPLLVLQFIVFNVFWVIGSFSRYDLGLRGSLVPIMAGLVFYGLIVLLAIKMPDTNKIIEPKT